MTLVLTVGRRESFVYCTKIPFSNEISALKSRKMSTASSSEAEMLMYSIEEKWSNSADSIFNQKIAKLTKSESLFNLCSTFHPSLTFSELELREIHLKNFKDKASKWEFPADKTRIPRMIQTKSLLRDELEILKINMSMHDKSLAFRNSHLFEEISKEAKRKKKQKHMQYFKRRPCVLLKCVGPKIKDLVTEIEGAYRAQYSKNIILPGSESAKTDTVIWKFLKRGPSFRRDYVNARKIILEIQTLQLPGLRYLSNSRFQNTQPVKVTCPNCMFFVTTHVKKVSSIRTKFLSMVLAIFGLCIVPHMFYAFKDTVHLCPLCRIYLGFCPAFKMRATRRKSSELVQPIKKKSRKSLREEKKMVSASSTSAKNLFVESKLRLSDRVQVNVNNISAIARQIQRGSKSNENLMTAAKNFALQEAAIENSETNLKKLKLLTTHISNQLDSLHSNAGKIELVLEQVRSMQR